MNKFELEHVVEVKGFDKWLGTSLVGEVEGYFKQDYYIIKVYTVIDLDDDDDYDGKTKDDAYYLEKQDQYHIIHRHFVCDFVEPKTGVDYNIGDVVEWNELGTMRKGVIIGERFRQGTHLNDPDEECIYDMKVEGVDEPVADTICRIRPYVPWP